MWLHILVGPCWCVYVALFGSIAVCFWTVQRSNCGTKMTVGAASHACEFKMFLICFVNKVIVVSLPSLCELNRLFLLCVCPSLNNSILSAFMFYFSVCDLLPLLGSNSVDLPAKQLFRLLHKSIEFYLCYLMSPSKAIQVGSWWVWFCWERPWPWTVCLHKIVNVPSILHAPNIWEPLM